MLAYRLPPLTLSARKHRSFPERKQRMTQSDLSPETRHSPIVSTDYADLLTPGVVIELQPDEADALGAFREDALSLSDALDANLDVGAA